MIETVRPSRLRRIRLVVAALTTILFGVAVVPPAARAGEEVFASVGTGELNGVYYPVGKAICEIVNRDLSIDGVRCSPEATPGSVYNIHAIQSGELEFGIVQADVNFNAYKGEGAWVGKPSALCNGALDANMLIVGHPSPLVKAQQAACAINLVAITGPAIDKLLHKHLYYQRETIPADIYGLPADVPTFGGRATLVTSASVDTRVVAVVAKEVLGHLAELRTLHPALARLRPSQMVTDGLTAPLHPGAEQVYRQMGLIE